MSRKMSMIKHILLIFFLTSLNSIVFSQKSEAKDYIIAGNQSYQIKDYAKAEIQFKNALREDNTSIKANYNLGNTLYHQQRYDEARAHYDKVIQNPSASKADKHKAFHNIGKSYLDQNNPEKAVVNLKEALKLNPYDEETRYNYALARKLLEKQQQEEKDQNDQENSDEKNQKDKGDQDQQGQDQEDQQGGDQPNQQGQNQNNQNGQQKGGQNGNEEGEGNLPLQQQITKGSPGKGNTSSQGNAEYHESLLEALRQQEQETLKRIISQKAQKVRVNTEKDW